MRTDGAALFAGSEYTPTRGKHPRQPLIETKSRIDAVRALVPGRGQSDWLWSCSGSRAIPLRPHRAPSARPMLLAAFR